MQEATFSWSSVLSLEAATHASSEHIECVEREGERGSRREILARKTQQTSNPLKDTTAGKQTLSLPLYFSHTQMHTSKMLPGGFTGND